MQIRFASFEANSNANLTWVKNVSSTFKNIFMIIYLLSTTAPKCWTLSARFLTNALTARKIQAQH